MSGFWYGMFVIAGIITMSAVVACPLDLYSAAAVLTGAFSAVAYLRMGDEARYF
jgi:hypothetical protein